MAMVWDHLSVEELEERFVGCEEYRRRPRHFQVIWLLARGHPISRMCRGRRPMVSDGWNNCSPATMPRATETLRRLPPSQRRTGNDLEDYDLLAKFRLRLDDPPPNSGV